MIGNKKKKKMPDIDGGNNDVEGQRFSTMTP